MRPCWQTRQQRQSSEKNGAAPRVQIQIHRSNSLEAVVELQASEKPAHSLTNPCDLLKHATITLRPELTQILARGLTAPSRHRWRSRAQGCRLWRLGVRAP
eukprot:2709185-Pleurochrysis_carterae.AAC.2